MATVPTEPLSADRSALLADFARTGKAAARAVSLYPDSHPAIAASLARVVAATARLTASGPVTFIVHRDALALDGRLPPRPDVAIAELAALLHSRLIGALTIHRGAEGDDWRVLLQLLARTPEELLAGGGIARAWQRSGRAHFDLREIDYADVLRERSGGEHADWNLIVAHCLDRATLPLDERTLATLLEALSDAAQFQRLVDRLQQATDLEGETIASRIAALMELMRNAVEAARRKGEDEAEHALQTIAASCAVLTPPMMLALLDQRRSGQPADAELATAVVERMAEETVASFMARAVTADHGATERLAQAIDLLAPAEDERRRVVDLARDDAAAGPLGSEEGFERLWDSVADTVMSYSMMAYSDRPFVPEPYGRALSGARQQALEVERVADDPPERLQGWLATVSEPAKQQLDLQMLLDLLRLEDTIELWEPVATIAMAEVDRRALVGDAAGAQALVSALVTEARGGGRLALEAAATRLVERLCAGPLARHVGFHLRTADDAQAEEYSRLCHSLGSTIVRSLTDALLKEEHPAAIRRMGGLLARFGPAGRRAVEHLKNSPNPAIRRTAVSLLRAVGGPEALTELASMLGDDDPEVQRESLRAIMETGTTNAYGLLQRLVLESDRPRERALRDLLGFRDEQAVPFFSYVLTRSQPRGRLYAVHASLIEALGTMKPGPESIRALQQSLTRGQWWAPLRTASIRRAAAAALRRLGTAEALAVLESAARSGRPGVRRAARRQAPATAGRESRA